MLAQYQRRYSDQYRYKSKRTDNGPTVSIQYTARCKRAEHHGAKDNEIIERLDTIFFRLFYGAEERAQRRRQNRNSNQTLEVPNIDKSGRTACRQTRQQ